MIRKYPLLFFLLLTPALALACPPEQIWGISAVRHSLPKEGKKGASLYFFSSNIKPTPVDLPINFSLKGSDIICRSIFSTAGPAQAIADLTKMSDMKIDNFVATITCDFGDGKSAQADIQVPAKTDSLPPSGHLTVLAEQKEYQYMYIIVARCYPEKTIENQKDWIPSPSIPEEGG